jgi:hypothetical protein
MHFVTLASREENKNATPTQENRAKQNKNNPVPRGALSQRAELFWHALHSGHDRGLLAGAASRFPLSLPFLLFLLSLLSSSLRFVFKNRFGEGRARMAATRMVLEASRVILWAAIAYDASLLRSEASKPVFWRDQHAKINKIYCSSKTKIFERYVKRI